VQRTRKILFVLSADLAEATRARTAGPRKDYVAVIEALRPSVLDRSRVRESLVERTVERLLGVAVAQAWAAFVQHRAYDIVITDGEHIGIPLALLLKLAGARTKHITIGHRLSTPKKRPFFRWLRVQSHMHRIVLHSKLQRDIAISELGISGHQLAVIPWQADTRYWCPQPVREERLVCSAGLEHRDYPTLFRAVDGLDVRVTVGAASHWSRQPNTALGVEQPANVDIDSFDYPSLRELFARSAFVVVPLFDIDFQAGITTILEAMSMGKEVIVTHASGQTDVVEDRRAKTRGPRPLPRPISLLRDLAGKEGVAIEPNGLYVPPSDPSALRRAIVYLLDNPEQRARLGAAGRRAVERFMSVEHFADRVRVLVNQLDSAPNAVDAARQPAPALVGHQIESRP
jgi:glycosyltransferase involved in cell wall biosynthesis